MAYSNPDKDDIRQTCRQLGLDNTQADAIEADIRAGEALLEMNDRKIMFDAAVLQQTQQHLRTKLHHRRWMMRLQRIAAVIVMALVVAGIWHVNTSPKAPINPNKYDEIPLWSFEVTRVNIVEQQVDPMVLAEVAATFNDCWNEDDNSSQSSGTLDRTIYSLT
ncbi:MAG: hypothetical protein JW709_06105 [Sedimentisphaerales bacterium]|nr:hypothetical protein [Sedimentisphaerales bacterium]